MRAVRSMLVLITLWLMMPVSLQAVSSYNNADPYPLFTAADPHLFLTRELRHYLKGYVPYERCPELVRFSISAFRQGATQVTDINGNKNVPLGNIIGRWNVLGPLFAEANGDVTIRRQVLNALNLSPFIPCVQLIQNPIHSDVNKEFGFFSVPVKYRKYGARGFLEVALGEDFGLILEGGVADIKQTATFMDLTCAATGLCCPVRDCVNTTTPDETFCTTSDAQADNGPCITANCSIDVFNCTCKELVIDNFMKLFDPIITNTLGLNVDNFERISAEDTRIKLFWRHIYEFNRYRRSWPHFLFMPFLVFEATAPTAKRKCPNALFSISAGNNGHTGLGFTAGFSIDFVETVEIVFEGSMTKFLSRTRHNMPVPTNFLQSTIYPQLADVCVKPGTNWSFGATLNAYHFLDRLSAWVQYVIVDHEQDCFKILQSNTLITNIIVDKLVQESRWTSHLINAAFQYDIAPHMALGFLWQIPLAKRNAYRSTTVLGSLILTY